MAPGIKVTHLSDGKDQTLFPSEKSFVIALDKHLLKKFMSETAWYINSTAIPRRDENSREAFTTGQASLDRPLLLPLFSFL